MTREDRESHKNNTKKERECEIQFTLLSTSKLKTLNVGQMSE